MKNKIVSFVLGVSLAIGFAVPSFSFVKALSAQDGSQVTVPNFIAHAGGTYMKYTYSNSKEALNNAYDLGYRLIEMDFYKTNEKEVDGRYVMLHSDEVAKWYFGSHAYDGLSYDEFLTYNKISYLTLLTAEDLDQWLSEHQDVFIVGDKMSLKGYKELGDYYPYLKKALIPQVNSMSMYNAIKSYGYKNIIWTVYSTSYAANPKKIVGLSKSIQVVGLTMPYEIVPKLSQADIHAIQKYNKIYVHTINKAQDVEKLKKRGIQGFYTDQLDLSKE